VVPSGIILAGGLGTRLSPLTRVTSKQLLPVYDKPMIFYPIATLMLAGVVDFVLVVKPEDRDQFESLLGNGDDFGIKIRYVEQRHPGGIPEAFILTEHLLKNKNVFLILGDNLFVGGGVGRDLMIGEQFNGARIFSYEVENPSLYGNLKLGNEHEIIDIVEKPTTPFSRYAVTGLYCFDSRVFEFAKNLTPSSRGELEITDLLKIYLKDNSLNNVILSRGTAWLDTGNFEDLFSAAEYVRIIQKRQGAYIACLEEIALRLGLINPMNPSIQRKSEIQSDYGKYLKRILDEGISIEPS
jgi:glucose-1-phosphate thymidylyltransferase